MTRAAMEATGWPITLATKGTVRLARGLTSSTYTSLPLMAYCTFIRPTTLSAQRDFTRSAVRAGQISGAERMGRKRAGAVARMDARLLDVLHHAGDKDILAVAQAVHVDFDGVAR